MDYNKQRTIYVAKQDYDINMALGELLDREHPDKSFRTASGEVNLSAVLKFCAREKYEELT